MHNKSNGLYEHSPNIKHTKLQAWTFKRSISFQGLFYSDTLCGVLWENKNAVVLFFYDEKHV